MTHAEHVLEWDVIRGRLAGHAETARGHALASVGKSPWQTPFLCRGKSQPTARPSGLPEGAEAGLVCFGAGPRAGRDAANHWRASFLACIS